MHIRVDPSFFLASTIAELQGDFDGLICPELRASCIC